MKLNWAERWVVNNPLRVVEQGMEIRRLKRMAPLAPGFTALEIGCGRGAGARLILREFQPARLHAMDLDHEMIRKAQGRLTAAELERVALFVADASRLPVQADSVDAVFGFGVLHHIPDWRSALAEVARVLKPAGAYYLEELYPGLYANFLTKHILLHPSQDRFSDRDLRQAMADAGLSLRDSIECRKLGILGVAVKQENPPRGR